MTVREAFSQAFGPVPEGATCHVGWGTSAVGTYLMPTYHRQHANEIASWTPLGWLDGGASYSVGPDISDRHAEAFLGFFGDDYDKVVQESQCP